MKLNVLYGVLTQLLAESPEFKLSDNLSVIHDTTLEDKKYYRIEFPWSDISVDGLKLHDMHMSIYQKIDTNNPTLGPSHFTAVFHDTDGQQFRMHLFLNHSDTLACSPTWEQLDNEHHYIKAEPPASVGYLSTAIWQQGLPCLQELRKQKKDLELRLRTNYDQLEQQTALLNKKGGEHRDFYVESLQNLIASAQLLAQISTDKNWPRIISYLKLEKNNASVLEPIIEKQEQKKISNPEKSEEKEDTSLVSSKQSAHKKSAKPNLTQHTLFSTSTRYDAPIVPEIQKRINKIENLFDKMSKTQEKTIKALLLIDLHNQLIDIDLEKEGTLKSTQIEILNQIEAQVSQQARALLQTALLKGDFDFVKKMSPFYKLISNDILSLALMQKNALMLTVLANDLELPINSHPINIKGKSYSNAVQYCFDQCSESNSLWECFSVLIEHGASLMQPVGPNKLPLAHLILSAKPQHPLYAALEQNQNLTLNNEHFYAHLIHTLNSHLRSGDIEESMKDEINYWIRHYELLKTKSENRNLLLNPRNQVLADEVKDILKKHFSTTMIEALEQDEDILRENNFLDRETKTLLEKIKVYQRQTGMVFPYQSVVNANGQDFKKELLKSNLQIELGFSEVKSSVLENLSNSRLAVSYGMELIEIRTMLKQIPQIHGKKNKRFKELDNRQKELTAKIEELNKMTPLSKIKEYNDIKESLDQLKDLVTNLDDLKKSATMMSEFFERLKKMEGVPANIMPELEEESGEEKQPACALQ